MPITIFVLFVIGFVLYIATSAIITKFITENVTRNNCNIMALVIIGNVLSFSILCSIIGMITKYHPMIN